MLNLKIFVETLSKTVLEGCVELTLHPKLLGGAITVRLFDIQAIVLVGVLWEGFNSPPVVFLVLEHAKEHSRASHVFLLNLSLVNFKVGDHMVTLNSEISRHLEILILQVHYL